MTQLGPIGVFLLMVPESACLPVPSEVTLMSAGFAVHQGWFSFPVMVAAATAGNLCGSLIAYWLGRRGVLAPLLRHNGRVAHRIEALFASHGENAVFVARLLPLARTFVSLPAGHAGIPLARFVALTIAGCAIWSAVFVLAGAIAGSGWHEFATTVGRLVLGLGGLALVALLIRQS